MRLFVVVVLLMRPLCQLYRTVSVLRLWQSRRRVGDDQPGAAAARDAAVAAGVDRRGTGRAARRDHPQRAPRRGEAARPRLPGACQQGPRRRLSTRRGRGPAAAAARSRRSGGDGGLPAAGGRRQCGRRRRVGAACAEQAGPGDACAAAVSGVCGARRDRHAHIALVGLAGGTRRADDAGQGLPRP